jgi:hypothetical protein
MHLLYKKNTSDKCIPMPFFLVEVSESISNQKFVECLQNMHSRLNEGLEKKLLNGVFKNNNGIKKGAV